ncbi:MAG: hypothetical protein HQL29_01885 [Candidatus Omnitrophica bacterium]|nr:hypothetical protein [Candidatus Omnitrophota bacterium]
MEYAVSKTGEIYYPIEDIVKIINGIDKNITNMTLIYYRQNGLIESHRRFKGSKKRFFSSSVVNDVFNIRALNKIVGMSLNDIRYLKNRCNINVRKIASDIFDMFMKSDIKSLLDIEIKLNMIRLLYVGEKQGKIRSYKNVSNKSKVSMKNEAKEQEVDIEKLLKAYSGAIFECREEERKQKEKMKKKAKNEERDILVKV